MSNRTLIDDYEKGARKVLDAIKGLLPEDMLAFPVPGTWSIQQIVLHVADAEFVLTDRMKRVIAEDNPALLAFDESKWVANLHYNDQSAADAAALIELVRKQMTRTLRALPNAAFDRQGIHSEAGPRSLRQLVEGATKHLEHHVKFIVDKREKLGKLMW